MNAVARRVLGACAWLAMAVPVLVHIGLAVLAVREFVALGWLTRTWFEMAAVSVVFVTAAAGLAGTAIVLVRAVRGARGVRGLARSAQEPCPALIEAAADDLRLGGEVDVVRGSEPFAVTYGLVRPRILVSTGLAAALTAEGIAAVLAHERHHVRYRDPLRLLAVRVAAGYWCWVPAAGWLARRLAVRRELAADRAAVGWTSRADLAGALLKLASLPASPALAAARPPGDEPGSLEARVDQLEGTRPQRPRRALGRLLGSGGVLTVVMAASVCCAGLAQALPGGLL